MATTESRINYLRGEIIGLTRRLDALEALEKPEGPSAERLDALEPRLAKVEFVVASGEFLNDTTELAARLDMLEQEVAKLMDTVNFTHDIDITEEML